MKNSPHAFPQTHPDNALIYLDRGMSLRDYFAAKAMQAIIQARTTLPEDNDNAFDFITYCGVNEKIGLENGDFNPPRPFTWGELLAVESYEIADCMLEVRNNERK